MPKYNSPQFHSFQGFQRVVITESNVKGQFRDLYEHAKEVSKFGAKLEQKLKIGEENTKTLARHKTIRLLDTFFSDSFPRTLLEEMIVDAPEKKFDIKILILDPFSHMAQRRSQSLGQGIDPVFEVNKALNAIRHGFKRGVKKQRLREELKKLITKEDQIHYLKSQLDEIETLGPKHNLEIEFYSTPTETPVYLISQFAAKGLILYNSSTIYNPWLIFVDDIMQSNDVYDFLSENFDAIWHNVKIARGKNGKKLTIPIKYNDHRTEELVFIGHGRSNEWKKVRDFLRDTKKLNVEYYENDLRVGKQVSNILKKLVADATIAVLVLTGDDKGEDEIFRPRSNVMYEVGMFENALGAEKTIILLEEGCEDPANLSGVQKLKFEKDSIESIFGDLSVTIDKIKKKLSN